MNHKINLLSKLKLFSEHWAPKVIAEMNDYQFKLVKLKGEFVWHKHDDTDETCMVIEGTLNNEFQDKTVKLEEGEMIAGKKGEIHKRLAEEDGEAMCRRKQ